MRTVLLYTYFNGFEQYLHSYKQMAHLFDDVVFCFQRVSNMGIENFKVADELHQLRGVHLLEYKTDLSLNTKENERRKHAKMIEYAKQLNATHFVLSAVDHVYSAEHLQVALNANVDVTFTQMYTYYKKDNWVLDPIEDYYMPFVHKLYDNTTIVKRMDYPVLVDPSVRVNTMDSYKVFNIDECALHHYSMVRNDIMWKFKNSASRGNWSIEKLKQFVQEYENAKLGDSISCFKGRKIVER